MLKKGIGLIIYKDLKNHLSYYKSISRVFKDYNIHIFCSYHYDNGLNFDAISDDVIYRKRGESLFNFYSRISSRLNKLKIVILEEHPGDYASLLWLIFRIKVKTFLTIHNVNSWVKVTFKEGFKTLIKTLVKKAIVGKVYGCIVISNNVNKYITVHKFVRNTFMIPFMFIDDKCNQGEDSINIINNDYRIVVPGNVSSIRRDYNTVLDSFEVLKSELPELKLVLLGRIIQEQESDLFDRINSINTKHDESISYWTTYVDQDVFEEEIAKANILIGNINVEYKGNDNIEYYGKSKESGIIFLTLKHKKITLVPKQYEVPKLLSSIMLNYNNDKNMISIILDIIHNRPSHVVDITDLKTYVRNMSEDSFKIINTI